MVKELLVCSTKERIQGIRNLPMSYQEKRHIRWVDSPAPGMWNELMITTESSKTAQVCMNKHFDVLNDLEVIADTIIHKM